MWRAGFALLDRLAGGRALAGLTVAFRALAYLGFAAPYLLSAGAHLVSYTGCWRSLPGLLSSQPGSSRAAQALSGRIASTCGLHPTMTTRRAGLPGR